MNKFTVIDVTGAPGGDCFLILTQNTTILVDTGFAFSARKTCENIRHATEGKRLDLILITHAHYDHVGGITKVKTAYPEAKICASHKTADIFAKESARTLMKQLDGLAADVFGMEHASEDYDSLKVDQKLSEGDLIEIDASRIHVMETPGHTRDCLAYYFEDEKFFVCTETFGVSMNKGEHVEPEFIVSFDDTMHAYDAAEKLDINAVLVSHSGLLEGEDATQYIRAGRVAAEQAAELIRSMLASGLSVDETFAELKKIYYDSRPKAYKKRQTSYAFYLNHRAMIERLAKDY